MLESLWTNFASLYTWQPKFRIRRSARTVAVSSLFAVAGMFPIAAHAVDVLVSSFIGTPDPAVRGGKIDYAITIANSDSDTAHNVVLTYPLPANTQFVSAADTVISGACTFDGQTPGTVTCTYPTLLGKLATPAGPSQVINVVLKTTGSTVTTLDSTAAVATTDVDLNPANNSLTQDTTINDGADLSAAMTGAPNQATGGGLVTWTVSGSNSGPNTASNATFTTTLPGTLTYVSGGNGSWSCNASGQAVTCTSGAIPVGNYSSFPISTRITGVTGGTVTLNGSITSSTGDPDLSNNAVVASVTVNPGADLTITQDAITPNPATSGSPITFVLHPANNGPYPATTGATVTFPLPAGFVVTSNTGSVGWSCTNSGSPATVTCVDSGSLASGSSGTLTVIATAPPVAAVTSYNNITATIATNAGGPADPDSSNNSAAASVAVAPDGLDLSISKSKSPALTALGQNMVSAIIVNNAGPRIAAANTITVVDTLDPAQESFVSYSGTNWNCVSAPPNVTCTYSASLPNSNSNTLYITTQSLAAGTATNTATVSYSGVPGDFNASNNSTTASSTVTATNNSPDLQVALSAATAGGVQTTVEYNETQITYTGVLTNKNIGTSAPAKDVVVNLSIPGRISATNVAVTGTVLTNTSGSSTATFSCTGTGTGQTGNVTCTQTSGTVLQPGDSVAFTVVAHRDMMDGTSNAVLTAFSTTQGEVNPADNTASVAVTIDPIADVELVSKVLAANPVLAGTNATYTVTARNDGPSAAANFVVKDVFTIPGADPGFTFVSASPTNGGACSGLTANTSYTSGTPTLTCTFPGSVANGDSRTVTIVVSPNWQAGTTVRTLPNTAAVSTSTPEDSANGQGTAPDSKSAVLTINPAQADMLIHHTDLVDPTGYDPVTATNNDETYQVTDTDNGPSLASGTSFTFAMTPPAGKTITFRGDGAANNVAAANPSGNIPASLCNQVGNSVTGPATMLVTCMNPAPGQIANGASWTRYLVFRFGSPPNSGGDIYTTQGTVIANETDPNLSNNVSNDTTTVRVRADIAVVKSPSINPVQLRQPFNWSVAVTNNGPGDSQSTGMTDTLPAGMAITGTPTWAVSGGGAGSCSVSGRAITCALGLLPANKTAIVTIPSVMTAFPSGGTAQNCASATTSEVDPNSSNNLGVCGVVNVQHSSIAGAMFNDQNRVGANGGTQQAGEPGVPGATITLTGTDAFGNAVSLTTTTDSSGNYSFNDLSPANVSGYVVTETQPTAYVNGPVTPPIPTQGGTYTNGGTSGNSSFNTIVLAANTAATGYNFPQVRRPSLSGLVYIDVNLNGTHDVGDTPISGATVRLLNANTLAVVATATSNAAGAYSFTNLDPLVPYTLEEPLPASPAGLGNGPVNPGLINGAACAAGCTAQPNTPVANTDRIASIDLSTGFDGTQFNFGEQQLTSIAGLVFIDTNRDMVLQPGETGRVPNVTIRLVQGADCTAGTTLRTTTTAADGTYSFGNVVAYQNYLVCETAPTGYGASSANGVPGNVIPISNLSGASTGDNFGVVLGSIAGSVYQDSGPGANYNNGVRDTGEVGVAGVPVTLSGTDANGNVVSMSVTTDASGNYLFDQIVSANAAGYTVTKGAIPPAAGTFVDGKDTAGTSAGSNAVQNVLSGIALAPGGQATGYLFGELPIAPISGSVYIDLNRNNAMDGTPTDGRLPGVTVTLHTGPSCSGPVFANTTTDASGNYSISGAPTGQTYTLCETQPPGYGTGAANPGTNGTAVGTTSITISALASAGSASNNFGVRAGSVSGQVYLDANDDGVKQPAEVGISGATVTLSGTDVTGAAVNRITTTDSTGAWRFDGVLAANASGYTVTEQAAQPVVGGVATLNGKVAVGTVAGVASGTAAPVSTTPGAVSAIALPAGADSVANNFAKILPVAIRGVVFLDINNNGVQDLPGDAGISGVSIVITGTDDAGAAVSRTVTTAADGTFGAADLRPGTYTVTEPNQPTGTSNGKTLAGTGGGFATGVATLPSAISGIVLMTPGASSSANNFAEIPNTSVIAGRVWLDANNNGVVDTGEAGIAGVAVNLSGVDASGAAVSRTAVTDANGTFSFGSLSPGSYALGEPNQPAGTVNGRTIAGSAGGTATSVATTPSAIAAIALAVGQSSNNNNFGEVPAASLAGFVYADNNNNGVMAPGESGLASVPITLTGADDQGNTVSASTSTAADGSYSFGTLRPGVYTLTEPTQPAGTDNGITTPGSSGGTATLVSVTPSAISTISLLAGANATGYNFGEIGMSPALMVSKDHALAKFTVDNPGAYRIRVRNAGETATAGAYTATDNLPVGITLAATPTGSGWSCTGAAGASTFSCSSSLVLAPGATNPNEIDAVVAVSAQAAANSPLNNAVMVTGGGELAARSPSAANQALFASNPASLPLCDPAIDSNVCRDSTAIQLGASLSGTVWLDVGSVPGVLDSGDVRLAGWTVEVVNPTTNQVVAKATTSPTGSYKVADLLPGTPYAVRFRDPQSGVVFGYPVNGESGPGSSGATCNQSAPVSGGTVSSCVTRGAAPQLTVVLAAGQELAQQSLPVDPSGVVYDSGLRTPVSGAVVTLTPAASCAGFNPATAIAGATFGGYTINGSAISMTVGSSGLYQFLLTSSAPASCQFALSVAPPAGYTFQSTAIAPTAGTLSPTGVAGASYRVQPQAGPPTGPVGQATTYYLQVMSGSADAAIVNNHIPLDPALPAGLGLSKTGDKTIAEVGDIVRYTVSVQTTTGATPRQVTVLDRLPAGFTYIKGTASVNGVAIPDPVGGMGPELAFNLGAMSSTGREVLMYRLRVGVGAQQGNGTNRAQAFACGVPSGCLTPAFSPLAGSLATNIGQHTVKVTGGVFSTDACVVGKVFVDSNGNHVQDPEELGIPGVRLVMQDGTSFITDSEGKYSYCGLPPRSAVIRVDESTLPKGSHLTTSSNRNLGDAGSLWLDLKNGEMHRADFIEGSGSNQVMDQVKARRAQGEVRAPEKESKKGPALRFDSKAHGLNSVTTPKEGTDSANQTVPKAREPVTVPTPPPAPPETSASNPSGAPTNNNNNDQAGASNAVR